MPSCRATCHAAADSRWCEVAGCLQAHTLKGLDIIDDMACADMALRNSLVWWLTTGHSLSHSAGGLVLQTYQWHLC